jgi:histidine triad (HIT) family protein
MDDCLFCRIAQKKIPADIVYETDTTLAFRDIHPRAPVHVLIIPKEHISSLMDLDKRHEPLLGEIHKAVRDVARQEKADQTGFRLVVNNGKDADQSVAHLHYHVLAGRKLGWPPG